MPHFVKRLGDVEEGSGAVLLGFESFMYSVEDSVGLFYCRVTLPEAKLMSRE
jgi:hypothetical protein